MLLVFELIECDDVDVIEVVVGHDDTSSSVPMITAIDVSTLLPPCSRDLVGNLGIESLLLVLTRLSLLLMLVSSSSSSPISSIRISESYGIAGRLVTLRKLSRK